MTGVPPPPVAVFTPTLPGARHVAGYVYEVLPSPIDASSSLHERPSGISNSLGNVGGSRDTIIPQASFEATGEFSAGRKRSATGDAPGSPRKGIEPITPSQPAPSYRPSLQAPFFAMPGAPPHPTTPPRSAHSHLNVAPVSSPITSNPLLHRPAGPGVTSPSSRRSRVDNNTWAAAHGSPSSRRSCVSNTAWAAAQGLLPISNAFQAPGYAPAPDVGAASYSIRAPHSECPRPTGQCVDSPGREMHVPASAHLASTQPCLAPNSLFGRALSALSSLEGRMPLFAETCLHGSVSNARGSGLRDSPPFRLPSSHIPAMHDPAIPHHDLPSSHPLPLPAGTQTHPVLNADLIAAIAAALGSSASFSPASALPAEPLHQFFSCTITNATSELPIAVIKELRGGFKNYIPLSLCTHKACSNATQATDMFDTEIGMNERGEIWLKQKTLTPAKDHYMSTDDFMEICENFTRGLRKYLILGDDTQPGGQWALACASMFRDFFSVIASRPDYTQDWPSYRGYIIELYTSWYKIKNLIPSLLEQLQPMSNPTSQGHCMHNASFGGGSASGSRGRGRPSAVSNNHRGGYHQQSFLNQAVPSAQCYLCSKPHPHRDHQGSAKRLTTNEHGKWIDHHLGNKIPLMLLVWRSLPWFC
ncbi:hypothetical protein BYT27DRAFT_7206355 [Phlegmacium glaucopus]|nr:hypothetical protein BYT27DRAFT_7206355 [Phlegmacium glaucopus]